MGRADPEDSVLLVLVAPPMARPTYPELAEGRSRIHRTGYTDLMRYQIPLVCSPNQNEILRAYRALYNYLCPAHGSDGVLVAYNS